MAALLAKAALKQQLCYGSFATAVFLRHIFYGSFAIVALLQQRCYNSSFAMAALFTTPTQVHVCLRMNQSLQTDAKI